MYPLILIPSHPTYPQHAPWDKKPLTPSQHKPKNNPNQKTKQPPTPPWDGETLKPPIPTKQKKPNYKPHHFLIH